MQAIVPAGLPEPMGYSHAVRAGDFLFPSGLMATDFVNGIASEARIKPGRPLDVRPVKQQTRYIYKTLKRVMEAAGSSLDHIVRLDQFTLNRETANDYLEGRNEFLLKDRPASTLVPVAGLLLPEAGIEVDAIGIVPRPGFAKSVAKSDKIVFNVGGGYSQSVTAGDFVFLAGCTASDHIGAGAYPGAPGTGLHPEARVDPNYWYGSEIKAQTRYIVAKKLGADARGRGVHTRRCRACADLHSRHGRQLGRIPGGVGRAVSKAAARLDRLSGQRIRHPGRSDRNQLRCRQAGQRDGRESHRNPQGRRRRSDPARRR